MLNKQNIKNWKSILSNKEWIEIKNSLKPSKQTSYIYSHIFHIDQEAIINDLEQFLLKSSAIKITEKNLRVSLYNNVRYYIHKFQYSFNEDLDIVDLFEYFPYYFRYKFLRHAIESNTFYFTLIKNVQNKILLSISIKPQNLDKPFKIEFPTNSNKSLFQHYNSIDEIEEDMQQNILLENSLLHSKIKVFYKDVFLGNLTNSHQFKLDKIDELLFKNIYIPNQYHNGLGIDSYSEYLESEYLPDYHVYLCMRLENTILVTDFEKESYGKHYILHVSKELLFNLNKLQKYIYEILWN